MVNPSATGSATSEPTERRPADTAPRNFNVSSAMQVSRPRSLSRSNFNAIKEIRDLAMAAWQPCPVMAQLHRTIVTMR